MRGHVCVQTQTGKIFVSQTLLDSHEGLVKSAKLPRGKHLWLSLLGQSAVLDVGLELICARSRVRYRDKAFACVSIMIAPRQVHHNFGVFFLFGEALCRQSHVCVCVCVCVSRFL